MSSKSRKGQIMASKEKRRKMESRKIESMFKSTIVSREMQVKITRKIALHYNQNSQNQKDNKY